MSNQIDLIYAKSVEEQLGRILPQLEAHHKKIIDISKTQIDFFGGKTAKSPADLGKVETQYKKIVDSIEKTRLAEIKLQQAREKAFDKYEAQLNKEQAKLKSSQNLYNKTQQQLNTLTKAYNDLITRKLRYNNLSENEEKRLITLQKVTERYNTTLKAVDATVGKHQRNVGNYASAFNPLSNSINQLTREMPAFTYSVQTGFMALSNNIPIFTDAISNAIAQNKILQAEGKPTTSVLKQLAGAFLSWQTLLGVGITLLTVYGKEIGDFLTKAFKGSSALDAMKESQSQLNDITKEGAKNAVEETVNLKSLLEIAKDTTLSYKQRKIAVDELQSTYPAYFGNLTQEQILAGKTTDAENALTEAILSRAKANVAVAKITENQAKVIDLSEQEYNLKVKLRNVTAETKTLEELQRNGKLKNTNSLLINYRKETDLSNQIKEVQKEINYYDEINNRLTTYAIEKQKESILLKQKDEKASKKEVDLLKDKYNARLSELELQLQVIDQTLNNDDVLADTRLTALELHRKKRNEIIALQYNEEMRLAKDNQDLQLIALNKYHSESLKEIEAYAQKELEINKSRLKPAEAKLMADNQAELAKNVKKATDEFMRNAKAMKDNDERMRKLKEITDAYLKTFQSEFFSNAGMPTLFKILNDEIVGFGSNWAVTFNAMTQVAQEAFQYIQQASNANFQNEYRNLETQYNVARKFAGDNADAQAEIDRQMEIRRREIRRREFKAQQKMALFNIAIDTAQAVVSSIKESPKTFGLPFSAFALAMGAIQAGVVLSQSVPEYWKGTDNAQAGLALTQEKGREFIFDRSGKLKSTGSDKGATLTKMDGGETVWDAGKTRQALDAMMFNDQLNNILSSNGIGSSFQPNNTTLNDQNIVSELREVVKAIDGIPVPSSRITNGDLENFIETKTTRIKQTNARRTFTPRNT